MHKHCFYLHRHTVSHEESALPGITLTPHCCYSQPVAQETSSKQLQVGAEVGVDVFLPPVGAQGLKITC